MSKEQKLKEAQELLKALGMPKKQYNQRSGWVFLALANIRPQDEWKGAQAPMLPTVEIMQFIREHYGQDYKPNSRGTIRRQTLHQFEQAELSIVTGTIRPGPLTARTTTILLISLSLMF